nr:hypothetical protein [Rhizobium miluonense]
MTPVEFGERKFFEFVAEWGADRYQVRDVIRVPERMQHRDHAAVGEANDYRGPIAAKLPADIFQIVHHDFRAYICAQGRLAATALIIGHDTKSIDERSENLKFAGVAFGPAPTVKANHEWQAFIAGYRSE